jgi:hypothetical protein
MAEFSKQYVQNFEMSDEGYDFDIEEIAKELEPSQVTKMICEGFGFTWIMKDDKGEIFLIFPNYETGEFTYRTIEETINFFKNDI